MSDGTPGRRRPDCGPQLLHPPGPGGATTDVLSDLLRPDGRSVLRPTTAWTPELAVEAVCLAERRGRTVVAHVDERATDECDVLTAAGFAIARREAVIAFEVATALEALAHAELPPGIVARSAAQLDEDELRLLDDELRQDVPGASGWRSTPEEFREQTFADPAFDPRTYLVAVHQGSGSLLGLVRVWMNLRGPRLGLVAVRRAHRVHALTPALEPDTG